MSQFDQTTENKAEKFSVNNSVLIGYKEVFTVDVHLGNPQQYEPVMKPSEEARSGFVAGRNSTKASLHDLEVALKMYVDKFSGNEFGWGNVGRAALARVKERGDSTLEEAK